MDINDLIADNRGIVYSLLDTFELRNDQDAESLAYEALYKAALTFDATQGVKFSTYAYCLVTNAMRAIVRHNSRKKQLSVISYHTPVKTGEDSAYLIDRLYEVESLDAEVIANEETLRIRRTVEKVLDTFTGKQRDILEAWRDMDYAKKAQSVIAKQVGVSQAHVSRVISAFKYKVKTELEETL